MIVLTASCGERGEQNPGVTTWCQPFLPLERDDAPAGVAVCPLLSGSVSARTPKPLSRPKNKRADVLPLFIKICVTIFTLVVYEEKKRPGEGGGGRTRTRIAAPSSA